MNIELVFTPSDREDKTIFANRKDFDLLNFEIDLFPCFLAP